MILDDFKLDSLLVYCDWLEDNDQLALATEIREEINDINVNLWIFINYNLNIGSFSESPDARRYGVGSQFDIVGSWFIEGVGGFMQDIIE